VGTYQHEVEAIAGGKYEVLRELGRGGMGVVYLARDTTLQREVAVKVMRASFVAEPQYVERFRREAQVVARLTHPNIVHINALEMQDERLLIEMPYLRGGSLRERMQRGMTTMRFLRVMHDALKALACCHAEGIIHRDVKPSNFLFDSEGLAKLSDFGAATLAEGEWEADLRHSRSSVIFIGTPQYACPEAWGGKDPTPAWDLYSLGMIAREAFLGELPAAPTPLSFLQGILTEPLSPLAEAGARISPELALLIDHLSARESAARLGDAKVALARLCETPEFADAASGKEDTVLMPPSAAPRRSTTRWPTLRLGKQLRRPMRQAGMLLVALLVVAAGIAVGMRLRPAAAPDTGGDAVVETAPRMTQQAAFVENTPEAEELLQLLRDPAAGRTALYELTSASTTGDPGQMLLRQGAAAEPHHVLGRIGDRMLGLQLTAAGEGAYRAEGWWGEYVDQAGRGPRFGWANGSALEGTAPGGALWLDLHLRSETDIEAWPEKFFAAPAPSSTLTDTALLHQWEASSVLMPLLFNEILPRDIEKGIRLGGLLPAIHGASTAVIALDTVAVPQFDGAIDDWATLDQGLAGRPERHRPRVAVGRTDDALVFAWSVDSVTAKDLRFELALLPLYHLPASDSPYLLFYQEGDQRELEWMQAGSAIPLLGEIEFASRSNGQGWSAELRIPYETIPEMPVIGRETVMRLNAALRDPQDPNAPLAVWGWPDLNAVQHGALLFFNPARVGDDS
jgi:hypothetical protein